MTTDPITDVPEEIRKFLTGQTDIITFRNLYDTHSQINDYLQQMVDAHLASGEPFLRPVQKRADGSQSYGEDLEYFRAPETYPGYPYGNAPFGCVRDFLTQEFKLITTNVRSAGGAWKFYLRLFDLYYQFDQSLLCRDEAYQAAYHFALDVIPEYLSGGYAEGYIQEHIIPLFPETMSRSSRIKAIKAKIREVFKSEKGFPVWIQSSEWPLGKDGRPATYLGRKKKHGGEMIEYAFRDESDGSTILVEQYD